MSKVDQQAIISIIEDAGVAGDIEAVKNGQSLSDAGIDSLDTANILLAIEEQFEIKIPDEDMDSFTTVDKMVQYLNGRLNG